MSSKTTSCAAIRLLNYWTQWDRLTRTWSDKLSKNVRTTSRKPTTRCSTWDQATRNSWKKWTLSSASIMSWSSSRGIMLTWTQVARSTRNMSRASKKSLILKLRSLSFQPRSKGSTSLSWLKTHPCTISSMTMFAMRLFLQKETTFWSSRLTWLFQITFRLVWHKSYWEDSQGCSWLTTKFISYREAVFTNIS